MEIDNSVENGAYDEYQYQNINKQMIQSSIMDGNDEIIPKLIQRLTFLIIKYFDVPQCITNKFDDISANKLQDYSAEVLEKAKVFIQRKLNSGRNADEIAAAIVYIALSTMNIDLRIISSNIDDSRGGILSDLQTFQKYVDIVEVFKSSSIKQYNSANSQSKIIICTHCIKNVVSFLILCEELIKAVLLFETEETGQIYKQCLQKILNIESKYINACSDATMMDILMNVDIWGREWKPELAEKSSNEKSAENNNRKRRRIEEGEDEEYQEEQFDQCQLEEAEKKSKSNNTALEQRKEVRNSIKNLIQNQLNQFKVEIFEQRIANHNDQSFINQINNNNKMDKILDGELNQIEKLDHELKDDQIEISDLSNANNFSQADNSPLLQSFAQNCMQLPFYIVCRQEELKNAIMKILSQPTTQTQSSQTEQEHNNSFHMSRIRQMRKLSQTVDMLVNQLIFGKKAIKANKSKSVAPKYNDHEINQIDLLTCCFTLTEDIDIRRALTEEQERRSITEQWVMPNYQSEQLSELIQSVLDELQKISPSKAKEVKKNFKENNHKTGIGLVPINMSRDLLAFVHNVTCQHILNITKRIFSDNGNLFSQNAPSWCVNPFKPQIIKSKRMIASIKAENADPEAEHEDNELMIMQKKKRKREE